MVQRYITAALIGALVTTSLLWVMHFLIEESEAGPIPEPPDVTLAFHRDIIDESIDVEEYLPIPPADPIRPPPLTPPTSTQNNSTPIRVKTQTKMPTGPINYGPLGGSNDGPLVNIISAQPTYPITATTRGIEGYVIVAFDVTAAGTVDNVTVIETSSNLFDAAAIKAAYQSRYKPQVVDGVAQHTAGLRKIYRFELEN